MVGLVHYKQKKYAPLILIMTGQCTFKSIEPRNKFIVEEKGKGTKKIRYCSSCWAIGQEDSGNQQDSSNTR
jgi:hypothetical protein